MTGKRTSALRRGEVLVMKVVEHDGGSYNGFRWPLDVGASVEAPDWKPFRGCGNGLHGWLWGLGDLSVCNGRHDKADAVWMALAVAEADLIDLNGKVKFPRRRIVFKGDRTAVANWIGARRPPNTPIPMFGQASAGYAGQASAGSRGQASAGEAGQASAGYAGQASAGSRGQASAGYAGQASAGSRGQASAGSRGQASAGADGLATAGIGGIVRGGDRACLVAGFWLDKEQSANSYVLGQVGRGGIEPNVWYEGSVDGLRPVPADDVRVKCWEEAWALFDKRKADREALAAKSDEAQRGALGAAIEAKMKAAKPAEVSP